MTRQNIQGNEWGNAGSVTDPGGAKQALGWIAEKPAFQTANFVENRQDEQLAHIEEFGVMVWDALTTYNNKSYAAGSDGLVYKSLQNANTNHDPTSSPSWWALAFMDLTTAQTVTGEKTFGDLKLGANADADNNKIVNLLAPTSNQDAANKAYVDGHRAYIKLLDVKGSTVDGGSSVAGAWTKRDINTEETDTGNNASISSSVITLAAGTYECRISAPAFRSAGHAIRLRNTTGSVTVLMGTSEYNVTTEATQNRSEIVGRFTIAAAQNLEIQHYMEASKSTDGLGKTNAEATEPSIYTVAEFWRIGT
ncbi:hypothetical protein KAR91_71240 [Candidatus Pacearchaeota archaeon]|nr:hypothetical protein [Candidatus Pacearchaeota archaeon]